MRPDPGLNPSIWRAPVHRLCHLVGLAVAIALVIAGCHRADQPPIGDPAPVKDAAAAAAPGKTIVLVRHAEKLDSSDDTELSAAGRERAKRLLQALRDAGVDTVYVSDRRRTQQTAGEVIAGLALGSDRQRKYPATDSPAKLARAIRDDQSGRVILVVAHSNTLPGLLKELGGWTEPALTEQEFDNIYVVSMQEGATPQLIRAGYAPVRAH